MKTTRFGPRFTMFAVGGMFTAATLGLGAIAAHIYGSQFAPSTGLMAALAFGWACAAMTLSMVLAAATSGLGRGGGSIRRGRVTLVMRQTDTPRTTRLTGAGFEAESTAEIKLDSRLPALFLFAASAGLAIVTARLYLDHRTTVMGAFIGGAIACYIASWGRHAWPRPR